MKLNQTCGRVVSQRVVSSGSFVSHTIQNNTIEPFNSEWRAQPTGCTVSRGQTSEVHDHTLRLARTQIQPLTAWCSEQGYELLTTNELNRFWVICAPQLVRRETSAPRIPKTKGQKTDMWRQRALMPDPAPSCLSQHADNRTGWTTVWRHHVKGVSNSSRFSFLRCSARFFGHSLHWTSIMDLCKKHKEKISRLLLCIYHHH